MSYRHDGDPRIAEVELAAIGLVEALLKTGDRAFVQIHPQAVDIANDWLIDAGYRLEKINTGGNNARTKT